MTNLEEWNYAVEMSDEQSYAANALNADGPAPAEAKTTNSDCKDCENAGCTNPSTLMLRHAIASDGKIFVAVSGETTDCNAETLTVPAYTGGAAFAVKKGAVVTVTATEGLGKFDRWSAPGLPIDGSIDADGIFAMPPAFVSVAPRVKTEGITSVILRSRAKIT